ncbi:hypothetical protein ACNOYE_22025 [Nannocystaceae bacterium ST9]
MTGRDQDDKRSAAPAKRGKQGVLESSWIYLLFALAVLVVGLVMMKSKQNAGTADVAPLLDTVSQSPLTDADAPALGVAIGKAWAGETVDRASLPARLGEPAQSVYVAFRAGGKRLEQIWVHPEQLAQPGTMWDALLEALKLGQARLGDQRAEVTRLEIDLTHSYRALDYAKQRRQIVDEDPHKVPTHQGVRGMRVRNGDRLDLWAPTWQVAANSANAKLLEATQKRWSLSDEEFAASEFHSFEADQILVRLDRSPVEAVVMFRGNRLVDVAEVDKAATERLAIGMKDWLVANLRSDGRLTYTIYPATGKEDKGNNMIRQWMATNAMIRWARDRDDAALFDLVEKNIDYNVAQFYSQDGALGRINERAPGGDKVKLGAVALAGMAMYTHPKREKWATQIAGLRAMVDHLWREDGSFASFYTGGSEEFWNFYPGEALLFWATIYAEEKDPEILRKYKLSVPYFKKWHLDPNNRNPAFVPWHLQANYTLWTQLGEDEAEFKRELVEYDFEIADWLVEVQQWGPEDGVVYPDEKGRFYVPDEKYGVPHASSTGVYIEGLIDAWQFARDVGDDARQEKYRVALIRGIRSMMQLQFVDDVDLFYVADPKLIVGGIRTTEYKSDIRCDNVQHPLMGIIKVLRMFAADEYAGAE